MSKYDTLENDKKISKNFKKLKTFSNVSKYDTLEIF
jgi:hypothetical protein